MTESPCTCGTFWLEDNFWKRIFFSTRSILQLLGSTRIMKGSQIGRHRGRCGALQMKRRCNAPSRFDHVGLTLNRRAWKIAKLKVNQIKSKFYSLIYAKRVGGAHIHVIAPKQHSSFREMFAAVASRWQHCVRFAGIDLNLIPTVSKTNALPID